MYKKKIIFLSILLFGVVAVVVAQRGSFGYTELTFDAGDGEVSYLQMSATGGDESSFVINIYNPTGEDQTIKLDFFDQVVTNDGEDRKACDRIHTYDDFASTLIWDTGAFVVPANSGVSQAITLNYNYCASGLFLGCAVQMPDDLVNAGDFDVSMGKANFVDFEIVRDDINCNKYTVKMLPGYRSQSSDFTSEGFMSYWIGDDFGVMEVNNINSSGIVNFSGDGIGQFMYSFPPNGSGFFVLLKVKGYLSVGYTGIFDINNGDIVDFTNNLSMDNYVYNSGWFNKAYLIDLPEAHGFSGDKSILVPGDINNNDYIGASDLALINNGLTIGFGSVNADYDLDKDGFITSKDQAILLDGITRNGYWKYFKGQLNSGLNIEDDPNPSIGEMPWIL